MSVKTYDWKGSPIYVGIHKAIVTDNKDPNLKGRIRVLSPVLGTTGWIHCTVSDDGVYAPPDVGSVVYVQFDGCDPDYPVAFAVLSDGKRDNPDTPTFFRRDVPTNRGWVSPGALKGTGEPIEAHKGHKLELDDGVATVDSQHIVTQTSESRGVRLTTSQGHSLKLIEEGTQGAQVNRIELTSIGGQQLQLIDDTDPTKQQIVIKDAEQRTIEIIKESDRIRIRNQSGTIYVDVDFANDTIEVDAKIVKLGTNATEHLVRGDAFRTLFNAHTHPTPAGPSLPPFEQMDPSSANTHLSKEHMVE